MIIVHQNNDHAPSTWKGLQTPTGRKASFTCPKGHLGSLADHDIADDGRVSPSVVCPYDGCDFHDFIKLEGWSAQ
jgi:hypothetical protein